MIFIRKMPTHSPNTPEEAELRSPQEILSEMELLDTETSDILQTIKELI